MPTLRSRVGGIFADLLPRSLLVRRGNPRKRRVALTFDDGPERCTRDYLDVLDRLEVRATFFLVGARCVARPEDVRAIVARGHEIAAHGYTHRVFPSMDREALADELARTREVLLPYGGSQALLRPPHGTTSVRSLLQCAAAGYRTVLWSLDSEDYRTQSPHLVAARVASAGPGDIVLLHEGQSWTREALPRIVEQIRRRGFEPATVSDVL